MKSTTTTTTTTTTPVAAITPEQLAALKERANAENERVRNDRFAAAVAAMLSTSADASALSVLYAARLPVLKVDEQGKTTTIYRPVNLSLFMSYLRKNGHKERAADMAASVKDLHKLLYARHNAPTNDTAAPSKTEIKNEFAAFVARYGTRKLSPVTSDAVNLLISTWVKVRAAADNPTAPVTVSDTVQTLMANLPAILQGMHTGFDSKQLAAIDAEKQKNNTANQGKQGKGKGKQTAAPAPVAKDTPNKANKANTPAA